MPLPTPSGNESESEFISRCMGDDIAMSEFPDDKQRYAVCQTQFTKKEDDQMTEQKREVITVEFKMEEQGDKKGTFTGHGSVFNNVDLGGDVIESSAFDNAMREGKMPAMLYMHDMNEPIGNYTKMSIDQHGLKMEGEIWVDAGIPHANQAYKMMTTNGPKGLSIGYIVDDAEMDSKGNRRIKSVKLLEVSPVLWPMNPKAEIISAKSAEKTLLDAIEEKDIRTAEACLRDAGLSRKMSKKLLADGWNGVVCDEQPEEKSDTLEILTKLLNHIKKG